MNRLETCLISKTGQSRTFGVAVVTVYSNTENWVFVPVNLLGTGLISSRLDYCNALYSGISRRDIQRLQLTQNAAARFLTHTKRCDHISPIPAAFIPRQWRASYDRAKSSSARTPVVQIDVISAPQKASTKTANHCQQLEGFVMEISLRTSTVT